MTRWLLSRWTRHTGSTPTRQAPRPTKLFVDVLEDRVVPASPTVKNTNDAGPDSFRQAIIDTNASGDLTNTITFLPGLSGTITLASDLPTISKPVNIQGPGSAILINGNSKAVFTIDDGTAASINVIISDLAITNGKSATVGGAVQNVNENVTLSRLLLQNNNATTHGGAVASANGTLTIEDSIIRFNNAPGDGGGVYVSGGAATIDRSRIISNNANRGGGIFQQTSTLTVRGSAIDANIASSFTGGIRVGGTALIEGSSITNNTTGLSGGGVTSAEAGANITMRNVTVSGNKAKNDAGGVFVFAGSVNIQNSTVAFNQAESDGAGGGKGGGIWVDPTLEVSLGSTIVAKNTFGATGANPDIDGKVTAASANNLVGDKTGMTGITNGINGNQVGAGVPIDPLLLPLEFVGLLRIHPLQGSSPALEKGSNPASLTSDGRGGPFVRQSGTGVDVGAFESQAAVPLVVTTADDENDATFDATDLSLREAIRFAGVGAPQITFAPGLSGSTINLTKGQLLISANTSIVGPGANKLTIDAGGRDSALVIFDFDVASLVSVGISGVTIQNGDPGPGTLFVGSGGILSGETLTLDGVTIQGNKSSGSGGGVLNLFGTLTVKNSTISGNTTTGSGGGIAVTVGNLVISNSTISGNTAKFDGGGVFYSTAGSFTLRNSTVTDNTADSDNAGGGKGGGVSIGAGTAEFIGALVSANKVGTTGTNPDVNGTAKTSFSFIGNPTGFTPGAGSDAGSILNGDAKLGALAFNGGPTKTHALASDSPAINKGSNPDGLTTDQRGTGFARVVGTAADIGAFEFNPNTPPTISDITDKTTTTGVAVGPIAFTVGDAETAPGSLTVTGTSSNTTLVPNANIVFGGSGANRTVTVTPAAGQTGTATVTVTVTDASGATATDTFTVTVNAGPPNTPPTVSDITNRTTTIGVPVGPIAFTVGDAETPAGSLTVTGTSSNTTLVPNANIVFGGSGANRTVTVTPAAGQTGTATVTVTVTDASGATATDTFTVTVNTAPAAQPILIGGAPSGGAQVFTPSGGQFAAGPSKTFFGGSTVNVRTATADVNGDGVADFIGGTGPGSATQVVVIDGKTGATIATISPFEASFTGGVFVTAADITGDGKAEVIVTPDQGGGPVAAIYDGAKLAAGQTNDAAQHLRYLAIDDPNFRGGARPTLGDITGDGVPELIVSAGFLGGPRITIWGGSSILTGSPVQLLNFFAFEDTLRNGAFVAAGDMTGDGKADIAFGGGPGGAPRVRVFDGAALLSAGLFSNLDQVGTGQVGNFFAGDSSLRGGVRLAMGNVDGDGKADLITGSGEGEASRVRVYLGPAILANAGSPSTAQEIDPFGSTLANGVFVG